MMSLRTATQHTRAATHLADKDGSSEKRGVAELLDSTLGLLGALVFDDSMRVRQRQSEHGGLVEAIARRPPTHPHPLDMPLGRVRTSEKTTLPAAGTQ